VKKWRRIPFVLILLALWAILRMSGETMSAGSTWGVIFIITGFVVLIVEFLKSSDIGMTTFKIEMAVTVFTTVLASIALTRLVASDDIHIGDVVLAVVVIVDAWLSPVNSFGMALRNIQGNVGSDVNPEGQ
jgi:uncharacterized membrane protein